MSKVTKIILGLGITIIISIGLIITMLISIKFQAEKFENQL